MQQQERFVHPYTGEEIPEIAHFFPGSSASIDDGRVSCPLRGLMFYLATGGREESRFINPGHRSELVAALEEKLAFCKERAEASQAVADRVQLELWRMKVACPATPFRVCPAPLHHRSSARDALTIVPVAGLGHPRRSVPCWPRARCWRRFVLCACFGRASARGRDAAPPGPGERIPPWPLAMPQGARQAPR